MITFEKISKTEAFQKLDNAQQVVLKLSGSRKTINDNVKLLQNVGEKRWRELSPKLNSTWVELVKELANEKSS